MPEPMTIPSPRGVRAARYIFWTAGAWGVAVLLFLLVDPDRAVAPGATGRPDFYYGFVGVGMAFQIAFWVIGADPLRFRPMMLVSVCEKFFYVASLTSLLAAHRAPARMTGAAVIDGFLGVLFLIAWWVTRPDPSRLASPTRRARH
jgi:hypothetical protein